MSLIERVLIGMVSVDSGQLMICDPVYLDGKWQNPENTSLCNDAHPIYLHKETNSLWHYTYGEPSAAGAHIFPGTYETVIPQFGKTPNQLIESGEFILTDIDPLSHIAADELSYRAICKNMRKGKYAPLFESSPTLGLTFDSGWGDGTYEVYADIVNYKAAGKRIASITIQMISPEDIMEDTLAQLFSNPVKDHPKDEENTEDTPV